MANSYIYGLVLILGFLTNINTVAHALTPSDNSKCIADCHYAYDHAKCSGRTDEENEQCEEEFQRLLQRCIRSCE